MDSKNNIQEDENNSSELNCPKCPAKNTMEMQPIARNVVQT